MLVARVHGLKQRGERVDIRGLDRGRAGGRAAGGATIPGAVATVPLAIAVVVVRTPTAAIAAVVAATAATAR